jgi:hypothetical protein
MFKLPDFNKSFEYENNFWLSSKPSRLSKILVHYELFKMTIPLEGDIVECGVFKGASFSGFAMMREIFCPDKSIIGFDVFNDFPETNFNDDINPRKKFIQEAGSQSIGKEELIEVLKNKGITQKIELIEGDICKTVPEYVDSKPLMKISLLNLDTDIYEPAVTILENFWPKIVKGGILILDDYNVFPGETKAVNEFFKDKDIKIEKFDFRETPYYIVKR